MTSPEPPPHGVPVAEYCRELEAYLCRKNDGHLIRVVGPAFDLVSRWARDGVPLRVAFQGIDRVVDRRARKGPGRRPIRIEFCEADVMDAFDAWRRAVGVAAVDATETPRQPSLTAHLERVLMRLTNLRATDAFGAELDRIIDAVSHELDAARGSGRGVRGDARRAIETRLTALDADLMTIARGALSDRDREAIARAADGELAPFRARMAADAFERARAAAFDRLVRDRFSVPELAIS